MNPQTFQEKYMPLMPRLYRTAFAILGNAPDAEDAVQETYMKLWQQADRIERMESPELYFIITLRHICITMLRQRHEISDIEDIKDEILSDNETDSSRPIALLRRALAALKPKARRIVILRHVGDIPIERIAELTGESEVNIRAILSRTRRRLRDELKRNDGTLTTTIIALFTTTIQ